jgi:tetratricopeptide (TPR) repeat protein
LRAEACGRYAFGVRAPVLAATVAALLGPARPAAAHGTFHELITAANQRVEHAPTADTYLDRGELFRLHGDWEAALADLAQAARLAPDDGRADLARGRVLVDAQRPLQAKTYLDRYLARRPESGLGFATRARALAQLGDARGAAEDWQRAVARLSQPTPDDYIERMKAEMAASDNEAALRGVDEGIAKLGPIVSLELPAIDLELTMGRYDGALARLALVEAQSPRKESYLARRGEILLAAGRRDEARQAFQGALAAVADLPPALRGSKAMVELEERARKGLALTARRGARAGRAARR